MLVQTAEQMYQVFDLLDTEPIVAIDTETNGLRPYHGHRLIGISFYFPIANVSAYLPFRHQHEVKDESHNLPIEWLDMLSEHYPHPLTTYVGHNLKFDLHVLHVDGFRRPDQVEETMIAAHLLNENEWLSNDEQVKGAYGLKRLAKKYLGDWAVEGEEELEQAAKEYGVSAKGQMALLPPHFVSKYAEMDTEITWKLREFYRPQLEKWYQWELYQIQSEYMLKFLFEAEKNGMYVNIETIEKHLAEIQEELPTLRAELAQEAQLSGNSDFNPGSPSQVLEFLRARGYGLESTGVEHLEPLSRAGDVWPKKILRYRKLSKLETSFYEPYTLARDPYGFIHTSYLVTGTTTGRLASIDPNLQQVPKKGQIKEVFEARHGKKLVVFDYSQLELRLAIHFSGEKKMREMFNAGVDLHQYTADELTRMLNYPVDRDLGKRSNFGLLYRMGGEEAALQFGIDIKLAFKLVKGWRNLYSEFGNAYYAFTLKAKQWRDEEGNPSGEYQFIRLEDNRIKHFHEFQDYVYLDKKTNEERPRNEYYKAWNFVIQGTGAGITRTSALRIARLFDHDPRVLPVLTVHDSLGWEVDEDFVQEFVGIVRREMTNYPQYVVPLKVEAQVGKTWGDMEVYHE
jgi:DNA polymerase I